MSEISTTKKGEVGRSGLRELDMVSEVKSSVSEVRSAQGTELKTEGENLEQVGFTENKFSLEQAQSEVRSHHEGSVKRILEVNSKYMYEQDIERISRGVDDLRAIEHNPYLGRSGAYKSDGGWSSIEVSAISRTQMERSTIHETHHFASKNKELRIEKPEQNGYSVYQAVGIREATWFHSYETGENTDFEIRGRGLNEGLTTLYTNEQLRELSPLKAESALREGIYLHATELSRQLEAIVGKDVLREAYYGGNLQGLERRVDALGGDKSYRELRRSFDLTLSRDYAERIEGMRKAQQILARMYEEGGVK